MLRGKFGEAARRLRKEADMSHALTELGRMHEVGIADDYI
jgi:hypothetical protein